jgi:hypothetical protein
MKRSNRRHACYDRHPIVRTLMRAAAGLNKNWQLAMSMAAVRLGLAG